MSCSCYIFGQLTPRDASCSLSSCLGCLPLLLRLPFLGSLLRGMFFLPYTYDVVDFRLFILLLYVFSFLVNICRFFS